MSVPFQIFGALPNHIEAAMRESIKRFGVLVPVVLDQEGRILDGHHRKRIAKELGVDYPTTTIKVDGDEEAREVSRTLNSDRRQLSEEQRKEVAAALRANGHSLRAIGGALGVSQTQVARDLSTVTDVTVPEKIKGLDGKSRSAPRQVNKSDSSDRAPKREKKKKGDPRDVECERLKAALERAEEKRAAAAEEAQELEDKLSAFEKTEPDEQQKEIMRLQKQLRKYEAEIARLTRARDDCNAKNNELIREVKRLRKRG